VRGAAAAAATSGPHYSREPAGGVRRLPCGRNTRRAERLPAERGQLTAQWQPPCDAVRSPARSGCAVAGLAAWACA